MSHKISFKLKDDFSLASSFIILKIPTTLSIQYLRFFLCVRFGIRDKKSVYYKKKIIIKRDFNENLCPLFIFWLFVLAFLVLKVVHHHDKGTEKKKYDSMSGYWLFALLYRNYCHKKRETSLQNDKIGRVIELINFFRIE